jgi:predicted kinase
MATVHLICGPAGVGKTTYAKGLAKGIHAVRFSIDDWMVELFHKDISEDIDFAWLAARVTRVETMIWHTAAEVLRVGRDVILDLGFVTADQRRAHIAKAAALGAKVQLYALDADKETRWQRIDKRNTAKAADFVFEITPEIFDALEEQFQPVTDGESPENTSIRRIQMA